jgi:hypothetical protein
LRIELLSKQRCPNHTSNFLPHGSLDQGLGFMHDNRATSSQSGFLPFELALEPTTLDVITTEFADQGVGARLSAQRFCIAWRDVLSVIGSKSATRRFRD